jgi:D-alanyl-D-alanine carboxypeptidase/D-alanyl-D-alanine-endopeptidase (penicillin-binding protein 4)
MGGRVRGTLALALALGLWGAVPHARADDVLGQRLDAALAHRGLRGARIAALVIDPEDGRVLYARDPDRALVPASNVKVLTAIAALSHFGPAHRFTTTLLADGLPDAQGAVQDLYVRGGGDPTLTSEDMWRMAADLRRAGLQRVRGDLVLDAGYFDDERWHPSWGRVSARAYHAPVSALSVNYGAYAVQAVPGASQGAPVEVVVDPAVPFLRLTNRAQTGPARGRDTLRVDRRAVAGGEEVLVGGLLRLGTPPAVLYRSVLDPVGYAGAVLRMQLESVGIRVDGANRRGTAPELATPLLAFDGKAVAEIVRLFVKYSNNAIAEGLVKGMGAGATDGPASWEQGLAAMRGELEKLGVAVEPIHLVDGSGLSYENKVSPRSFVEALEHARLSFRFGPEFVAALPIAAADGTLKNRADAAALEVRAKTGLLTRVTGLSGYAERPDGHVVVFSVLTNGWRGSAEAAMDGVDAFVSELVADPTSAEPELGG